LTKPGWLSLNPSRLLPACASAMLRRSTPRNRSVCEPPVEVSKHRHLCIDPELRLDSRAAGATEAGLQPPIERQTPERSGHRLRIPSRNDEAFDTIRDRLPQTSAVGDYDRECARHRFEDHRRDPLAQAGVQKHVGLVQALAHTGGRQLAVDVHAVVETEVVDREQQRAALRGFGGLRPRIAADEVVADRYAGIDEPADRLERVHVPLQPDEIADADYAQSIA
jgi:hypothetical protein